MKQTKKFLSVILVLCMICTMLPSMTVSAAAANEITVTDWNGFLKASETENAVIILSNNIESPQGAGDDALFLKKSVTIRGNGNTMMLNCGGIVLGGNVTFENITLYFANMVRNAIIANGHTLTLNGVKRGNLSPRIHLFCGSVSDYNGSQAIPETGPAGHIIIKGENHLGDIFAGSLSDGADETAAKPNNFTGSSTITIESSATHSIENIYAHGARESRGEGSGDLLYPNPERYKVTGGVSINLNNRRVKNIYGQTGGSSDAVVTYTDSDGKGYLFEPMISSIGKLVLQSGGTEYSADLQPATGSSFSSKGAEVSAPSNTRLSLVNFKNDLTINNFTGGGELVLGKLQTLTISGTVNGTTGIGIGEIFSNASTTVPVENQTYIVAPNSSNESFKLIPHSGNPDMVLNRENNGDWVIPVSDGDTIIVKNANIPEQVSMSANSNGKSIPLTINYQSNTAFDSLLYVPVDISVNGSPTTRTGDEYGGFDYTIDNVNGNNPLTLYFHEQNLYIGGISSAIPTGIYQITFTIPARNMVDRKPLTLDTTLIVPEPTKKEQATLTINSNSVTTYGKDVTLSTSGGTGAGDVTYFVTNGTGAATISGNVLTPTKVGTVTVTAIKAEDETYNATFSDEMTITIDKATPTGTPEYTHITTSGKTLADAGLTTMGSTFNTPGTVVWELADTTSVEANTPYKWIFTPTDTINYNSLTDSITLYHALSNNVSSGSGGDMNGGVSGGMSGSMSSGMSGSMSGGISGTTNKTGVNTSDGATTNTNTKVTPNATTKGSTSSVIITASMGQEIVEQAVKRSSTKVIIAPNITGNVNKAEVSIPSETIRKIGQQTKANLTVSTPMAEVSIPNGSLSDLSSKGGNVTVSTEKVGNTITLGITASGENITKIPLGILMTVSHENTTPGTVAVIVHEDGTREIVKSSVSSNGKVFIPLSGSTTVELVENRKEFEDVRKDEWHKDAADFVSARGLLNGTSQTRFSPEMPMTRGMLAQVLYNLENNPDYTYDGSFQDIKGQEWFFKAALWAAGRGIILGYEDGSFRGNDPISREQLAVILWRYSGGLESTHDITNFSDAVQVSDYAKQALAWANENGIINGKGSGILDPKGQATRAQVAQMLKNLLENMN